MKKKTWGKPSHVPTASNKKIKDKRVALEKAAKAVVGAIFIISLFPTQRLNISTPQHLCRVRGGVFVF